MQRAGLFLSLWLFGTAFCAAGSVAAKPLLVITVETFDWEHRGFLVRGNHSVGGRAVLLDGSIMKAGKPDTKGRRRIRGVWIPSNWTKGFVSVRRSDQSAAGHILPTGNPMYYRAVFTALPPFVRQQ